MGRTMMQHSRIMNIARAYFTNFTFGLSFGARSHPG
jgi:hypothetical protein